MLLSIEAEEKAGKSTLAYTAPLPIVGFSFDMGSQRAVFGSAYEKFFKDLRIEITSDYSKPHSGWDIIIYERPIPIQLTDSIKGCRELFHNFQSKYAEVGLDSTVSSMVFDTATLVRKLAIEAYLEELQAKSPGRKQLLQIEYAHPNDEIRNMWNFGQAMGKNMVGTHHLTEEYKNVLQSDGKSESVPTGNKVLEGYNKTHQAVDVAVRLLNEGKGTKGKIMVCGYDRDLAGQVIDDPSWDKIVSLIKLSTGGRIPLETRNG